tara:strand:- start:1184 stop:2464 length:1281 start_codon:yes stop_codon:yes gene_type:complete
MGIIRLLYILIILSNSLFAQTNNNIVKFDDKLYIKHTVKAGESLNKIANIYNVKVNDILKSNEIQRNLYYNQQLYIPIQYNDSLVSNKENNKEINIALLMPYYVEKNDTMFDDFEDTLKANNLYFTSSEIALSFHIGVKLALDSLNKLNTNIVLHTFDTNNDTNKVLSIVESGKLDKMDYIIGPLRVKNFNILCKKYGNSNKILINPLSRITNNVNKYKAVYQIYPRVEDQLKEIVKFIDRKYKNKKILILYQNDNDKFVNSLTRSFKKNNFKEINTYRIEYTHVDSIRDIFSPFQIVLIPSTNKAFVSKVLSSIRCLDSTSIVFGLNSWVKYDNLDIDDLMELNLHLPLSNQLNYFSQFDKKFIELFESTYLTNHAKYSYNAYSIIMHFFSSEKLYKFKKLLNGGYVNITMPIYNYYDYDLILAE